jgi:hypothetical protein
VIPFTFGNYYYNFSKNSFAMPKGIKLSKISTKAPKELKKGKIVERVQRII